MQNERMPTEEKKTVKKWKQWFQRDNLIVLVLTGVLLFIIALPIEKKENAVKKTESLSTVTDVNREAVKSEPEAYDYAAYLEQKLEGALQDIAGVGRVEVMLTLQASEELVVEKDTPVARSSTNEADAEGGSRQVSQVDTKETTIYRTEGSNSEPYVIKTLLPRVEGVLVVAEGAGSGTVDKSITEIVQALFGVEAHKVKVVAMRDVP